MVTPKISERRLLDSIDRLSTFGRRPDGGVDRVAGSAADLKSRNWMADYLRSYGLESWTDEAGNVFGHMADVLPGRLLIGSHSDTVPAGGRLDGAYGVMAAVEVLITLHQYGHPALRRLEVVSFWDEEGAQPESSGGMVGSTSLCSSGHLSEIDAYLELHIEQGPRMEQAGHELCLVEGIVGVDRHLIRMVGEPNHAGTTPFARRRDAGHALVQAAMEAHNILRSIDDAVVGNIGTIAFEPGAPNVVPGAAQLVLEIRAPDSSLLTACADLVLSRARECAEKEGCVLEHRLLSHKPVVAFDKDVRNLLERVIKGTGRRAGALYSYAGHDAGVMSAHLPAGMLFVPSTGGVSHSPFERTPEHLLVLGAQALLESVITYDAVRTSGTRLQPGMLRVPSHGVLSADGAGEPR